MEEKNIYETEPGWVRTDFDITPLMSTYILAFVVSDFKYVSTTGPNGLKIRVWARDDYINNTEYAIKIIPKAFEFFEDYFNISEVVKKSDHFASPDFNAGAMEVNENKIDVKNFILNIFFKIELGLSYLQGICSII